MRQSTSTRVASVGREEKTERCLIILYLSYRITCRFPPPTDATLVVVASSSRSPSRNRKGRLDQLNFAILAVQSRVVGEGRGGRLGGQGAASSHSFVGFFVGRKSIEFFVTFFDE